MCSSDLRTRAEVDAIQPGNLILVPAEGVIDWTGNRVRWDDRIAAPDRDQTFRFDLFLVRDRLNRCAVPLDESFPAPSFQTIDISVSEGVPRAAGPDAAWQAAIRDQGVPENDLRRMQPNRMKDRKSTRLNSSHLEISYAVFCLKKKITIL